MPLGRPHQASGWVPHVPHRYPRVQFPGTLDHPDGGSNGSFTPSGKGGHSEQWSDVPYARLMSQKKKCWLIKIQLLPVQAENPEVDDYEVMSAEKVKRRESAAVNGRDGDKLRFIRPERVRTESKSYTPIQFERSLDKLLLVRVNYPRKIVDVGVQLRSEDEEQPLVPGDAAGHREDVLGGSGERGRPLLLGEALPRATSVGQALRQDGRRAESSHLELRGLPKLLPEHVVALMEALLRHLTGLQRRDQ
ncbi:hypothetical protein HPB48_001565 [Haemaphysalis longicornis]|uniref:Uncharacterized protein n=1 Tax=Haemaphysalis longicornis TaxID=44386 RepID=A0A9J6FEP8_HAELO|nr:hypothetical protein HPB48_001565 [Haemaphysalis longicornis]